MVDELNEIIEHEESQMDKTIPFGIACFHFGIAKEPPFRYTDEQYISELRKALESIPNIEQISIVDIYEGQNEPRDISEKLPDIHEAGGIFPNWDFGKISFFIHIPDRIQRQILKQSSETYTERFEVSIIYGFEMPVTFIIPLDPIGDCNTSYAVIIVREFLDQQFMNIKSEYIKFEVLGPSPFHANCYIKPGKDIESVQGFICEDVTKEAGYDKLIFYYDVEVFENGKDVQHYIFSEILLELSFFYEITQSRANKIRRWYQIDEMLRDIIPRNRKNGIWNSLLESISYSGKIKELFIAIAIFERDSIFVNERIRRDYKGVYSERWISCFQNFIDISMKEEEIYPTKELIQLLSYLEDKRAKNMELLIMFVSAIIGGSIGALIALLVTIPRT